MSSFVKTQSLLLTVALSFVCMYAVGQRQIETLGRGTFAMRTSTSAVLVSWRWLATDPDDVSFNVYRDGVKLNATPLASATNYVDNTSENGSYLVKAIINDVEVGNSEDVSVVTTTYFDVPLQIPTGGTTPSGETYTYSANDASVGDVDGDGVYEIILKWDPSNSKDNSQSGYTGNVYVDCYKLNGTLLWRIDLGRNIRAGAHYTQFMVYDLDGDGKAELACKTAPNTKDGLGNFLSKGPAVVDNDAADYRNSSGYILDGPEYLTIFSGMTGAEMATVSYNPSRGTVSSWGDSYGNRVDRFLACVAYLDGERPSLVMCRGYYTRATLAAWDWRDGNLTQRWFFDSNTSGNSGYAGQGNHNLSVADVDGDGKDEIIYGSCTIDHDGKGLYSTGLGHGDALHVADHAPERTGLEVFAPHEESGRGISFRDAKTGTIIWQKKALGDIGRGVAADISADYPGSEFWAAGMGMYNLNGEQIATSTPSINHIVWWDGDLTRELLDGTSVTKYGVGTLLSASGCSSNNSTKSNPALQVDLWGDWREEIIWRTSDNSKLRIYSTPYASNYRFRTLMHDPVYRLGIVWQNVAYNQPPHVGFYLGNGMDRPPLAPVMQALLKWDGASDSTWDLSSTNFKNNQFQSVAFANGNDVMFSISGNNVSSIHLSGDLWPSAVYVVSASDYEFSGGGSLSGNMFLTKAQSGKLTIDGTHVYTGITKVSEGHLQLNGSLSASKVLVNAKGELSGTGIFGNDVELQGAAKLYVGNANVAGNTTIEGLLVLGANSSVEFDLSSDTNGNTLPNDKILVSGDLIIDGHAKLIVKKLNDQLGEGNYVLATFDGLFKGNLSDLVVDGIMEAKYSLEVAEGMLILKVESTRTSTSLVWNGGTNSAMDLLTSKNWLNQSVADWFVAGDVALFDDAGSATVMVSGKIPASGVKFDASQNYTLSGSGAISGPGGLEKENVGSLVLNKYNEYTGPTIVNGGTLEVTFLNNAGMPSSIGAASADASNWIIDGGKLRYAGNFTTTNRGLTVGGNGGEIEAVSGATIMLEGAIEGGTITKTGTGTLVLEGTGKNNDQLVIASGIVKLYSDNAAPAKTVVFNGGTLNCHDNDGSSNTISWNISVPEGASGTINLDSRAYYTGTLTGIGTLNVNIPYTRSDLTGNWSSFTGTLNFASTNSSSSIADLRFGNSNGLPNATVNVGANVTAYHLSGVSTKIGALTGTGILSGSHNWELGAKNINTTFSGTIAAGSLTKVGSGTLTLSGANTYTGYTQVNGGALSATNTSGSATGTGVVTIMSGGALSGNGILGGIVNVESGGVLYGGHTSVGTTLTIQKQVTLKTGSIYRVKVNALFQLADRITAPVGFKAGGTLDIVLSGGVYSKGRNFKVIDSPIISGTFDAITPAVPAEGLYWDTSELYTAGVLKITDIATAVKPLSVLSDVTVYPNPVRSNLMIKLPNNLVDAIIDIVDLVGREIEKVDASGHGEVDVDTSGWRNGIYLVRIVSGKDVLVKKIVKE
ncbi:MAG: autotransporter-associated beta strand repeat-containing protein [Breznakibacter sp.]